MSRPARGLVRFPGSGTEPDGRAAPAGGPLDRYPLVLKVRGGAGLLYGAYFVGWSTAEPAQGPPIPPATLVAPVLANATVEKPDVIDKAALQPVARPLSNEELREVQAR